MRLNLCYTLIACAIFTASCTTETKVQKWLTNHPLKQAEWCAEKYPVKTEYLKGETIVQNDTTFVKGDSIPCPDLITGIGKKVKVKCPDQKTIYKTLFRVDTLIKENTAQVAYYKGLYDLETIEKIKIEEKLIEANQTAKNRLKTIFFLIGLITIGIALKFSKYIFPHL